MDHHLHIMGVGNAEAAVDGPRRRSPVLMQFEAGGPGQDLLGQAFGPRRVALAGKGEVHREGLGRLQHAAEMPGPRRAGRCIGARGRTRSTPQHGGDPAHQGLLDLLRADEVDVHVQPARGQDLALAGDRLGAGADDDVDAWLGVRIAGLADAGNPAVLEADIGFDDAPVVDDQRIGDHGVHGTLGARGLALAHAVADHLAAAELDLLAIDRPILLDLEDEIGVGQAHAVAHRGAVHVGIGSSADLVGHQPSSPMTC